jgi:hypothetical protein
MIALTLWLPCTKPRHCGQTLNFDCLANILLLLLLVPRGTRLMWRPSW